MEDIRNMLIVTVATDDGDDFQRELEDLGLTFDSTEKEILEKIQPLLLELHNVDIRDTDGDWLFKVRKAPNTNNIYVIPNSTAG